MDGLGGGAESAEVRMEMVVQLEVDVGVDGG